MTDTEIRAFGQLWADAEVRADVDALDAMTVADFTLVGPLGFVLDKQQWLDRYRSGDLVTSSLTWDNVAVREYATTAVAIGRHTQQAAYRGTPSDGAFRATHILVRSGDHWQFAGIHLSPIASPPGRPNA
ncbi:nuclear transport factor 2 family protein [Pseudarthrobacter sp. S9]|uniref:nuclear transport factor 2 family protein n=1 Tax=Pseudarthrobacter sp. S9 TaxID=3418421 RepID=UPI003D046135